MPPVSISAAVREILSKNIDLPADEVIRRAKARGLTATDTSIRHSVHNMRSVLRKQPAAKPAPVAARQTPAPKPAAVTPQPTPAAPAGPPAAFSTLIQVNSLVGVCGGVENLRRAAEVVRACGSVEAFLQHLDLVAAVRAGGAS